MPESNQRPKILVIRFSSFGDIMQALPCASSLRAKWPQAEIHWLTRSDFAQVLKSVSAVDVVWSLSRQDGLNGLLQMARQLRVENFTHVYDAHSNLRSYLISTLLRLNALLKAQPLSFVRRPKSRLRRLLLFNFKINTFEKPFRGAVSYLNPLSPWAAPEELPPIANINLENEPLNLGTSISIEKAVVLAPGATWPLKVWPLERWVEVVRSSQCDLQFLLLGGPEDIETCEQIARASDGHAINFAGKLTWAQSLRLIQLSRATVAADTGLLHAADVMGRPAIALIGPTAFGYPSQRSTQVLEKSLSCRPCSKDGRGKCHNTTFKKCMIDISANDVVSSILKANPNAEF